MPEAESWTIGRLLTWTTDFLKRHGSESSRLEAEVLLADARGCERIQLYTAFGEEVSEEIRTKFRAFVQRRAVGEPALRAVHPNRPALEGARDSARLAVDDVTFGHRAILTPPR